MLEHRLPPRFSGGRLQAWARCVKFSLTIAQAIAGAHYKGNMQVDGTRDGVPDWSRAPEGWDWLAQDEDGRWFWYRNELTPGFGGGVWRANSRNQQYAGQGQPNALWMDSLRRRYY